MSCCVVVLSDLQKQEKLAAFTKINTDNRHLDISDPPTSPLATNRERIATEGMEEAPPLHKNYPQQDVHNLAANETLVMSEVPQSHGPAASHRDESEPFPKRVYNDAKTWLPSITAQEVEDLIKKFQLEGKAVNYESLAMLIGMGDWESVQVLLDASLRGPAPTLIDVNEYLDRHLINVSKKCDMMKKECRDYVDKLSQRVRPQPASCKRNVAFSYSPRGSGKTQLVKYFLSTRRTNAVKWGRVIVRCCEKGKQESWLRFVKAEAKSDTATVVQFLDRMPGTDKGLCELIRAHVKAVTGREQNMSNYVDAVTAYKTWMSATASHFGIPADAEDVDPLIVLDTCEDLANLEHNSMRYTDGESYTLLEALMRSMPSPHCILAVGCNARIDDVRLSLGHANVVDIGASPV